MLSGSLLRSGRAAAASALSYETVTVQQSNLTKPVVIDSFFPQPHQGGGGGGVKDTIPLPLCSNKRGVATKTPVTSQRPKTGGAGGDRRGARRCFVLCRPPGEPGR